MQLPLLFPMHPRTLTRIKEFGLEEHFMHLSSTSLLAPQSSSLYYVDPFGYLDFISLMSHARLVLTDGSYRVSGLSRILAFNLVAQELYNPF